MQLNKLLLSAFLSCSALSFSQVDSTEVKKDYGRVFGGFESNSQ